MILRRLVPLLLAAATLGGAALPSAAAADPFAPPKGKVFNGLTAGFDTGDFQHYAGKHPAVWQHFIAWGGSYQYTIKNSARAGARLMLHIGTARGQNMPEKYSPAEIARGQGDQFLVNLTRDIADVGAPVYIRLMGEMNNCNNAYSSYSCGGGRRDAAHSAANWKLAWKRAYLILHGGDVAAIDAQLDARGLPHVQAGGNSLPVPQVAFMWAPMVGGAPNIAALDPRVYWPGSKWVDWVGTSFYSRFPNFTGLESYYKRFAAGKDKPFAIAEWAIWGSDAPAFANRLFDWVAHHKRTKMMQYNQGAQAGGIFRLSNYPASARVVRHRLAAARFLASAG